MFKVLVLGQSCLRNEPLLRSIKNMRDQGIEFSICVLVNNYSLDYIKEKLRSFQLRKQDYVQFPGPLKEGLKETLKERIGTNAEILLFPIAKPGILLPLEVIRRRSGIEPDQVIVMSYNNDPNDLKMLRSAQNLGYKTFPEHLYITKNAPEIFTYLFIRLVRAPL